jgi:predicted nucleotidyltransferase
MDKIILDIAEKIDETFKPVSVFLYGSRARNDYLKGSDFELGVLYPKENKITRNEINEVIDKSGINIYPFEYERFIKYEIDTPFPLAVYYRDLIMSSKTILGENTVEALPPPSITTVELLKSVSFNKAQALCSIFSYRNKDLDNASKNFYKSCLYGLRSLIILKNRRFPATFREIYELSSKLDFEKDLKSVVTSAIKARKGADVSENILYKNISLLGYIEGEIEMFYKEEGDIQII